MSKTLNMSDAGWDLIRVEVTLGRRAAAIAHLTRILAIPDVPAARAAEGHRLAGELALELERFATARRHLRAAAALEPQHAGTQYLLGRAWEDDPHGCDRRAARRFRKATRLDATNPLYRAAFGRAAARCGIVKRAARELAIAANQAPGEIAVIRVVVGGLLDAGKPDEARKVLDRAGFLRPNDADLAALRARVQFEVARLAQRKTQRAAQDAPFATEGDPSTIPFLRLVGGTGDSVRRDAGSVPRPHLARLQLKRKW